MSIEEFFRKPGMSRVREMWCAAHFARSFDQHVARCLVQIDEVDSQDDVDFELVVGATSLPFQVAEVMEPDRRRSAEYKNFQPGVMRQEDWSRGTANGPEWIRRAIESKLNKNYARETSLNLLLYINYPAYHQNYFDIRQACSAVLNDFASTWLLAGDAFASLRPIAGMPSFEGWKKIPESLAHDEP